MTKDTTNGAQWYGEETVQQALKLAFYLLPIKEAAVQAVREAVNLARIKSYEKQAHRRRFFQGNKYKKFGPSRALLGETQMIQSMIFSAIQKYEKLHEGDADEQIKSSIMSSLNKYGISYSSLIDKLRNAELDKEDLIIRYMEALVRFSNNNSEDLAVSVLCLVCNFQPHDSSKLHTQFFKEISPEYCRKRKSHLMKRLENRFSRFVKVCKSNGKSNRFQGQEKISSNLAGFAEEFFALAIPWGTACPDGRENSFSERMDGWERRLVGKVIARFFTHSDLREINYIHALTCPNCFIQIMREMKMGCPREHLALPEFFFQDNREDKHMNKKERRLQLDPQEAAELMQSTGGYLTHEEDRRKKKDLKKLIVTANDERLLLKSNGLEMDAVDLQKSHSASFKVGADTDLIKIISEDEEGEFVVAVQSLNCREFLESLQYRLLKRKKRSIRLQNGQSMEFTIEYREAAKEEGEFLVEMLFPEIPATASRVPLISLTTGSHSLISSIIAKPFRTILLTTATLTIIVGCAALIINMLDGKPNNQNNVIRREENLDNYNRGIDRREIPKETPQSDANNIKSEIQSSEAVKPGIASFELKPDNTATEADRIEPTKITFNPKNKYLQLKLHLNGSTTRKKYYVEVESADISHLSLWSSSNLKTKNESDRSLAVVEIPTRIFSSGQVYSLKLKEADTESKKRAAATYSFRIIKQKIE